MFPVRYELNSYIFCRRNSVFKGLNIVCRFFSRLLYSAFSITSYMASNHMVNDELESIWKKAVMTKFSNYHRYFLVRTV
jgi:hypothetical protein